MSALIEVTDLTAGYHGTPRALDGVSFAVGQGDFVGLIGPNGAGKSTLFACMLGLITGYSGTIRFFGRDIRDSASYLRAVGYVEQRPAFDKNFPATVREVVRLGVAGRGGSESPDDGCCCCMEDVVRLDVAGRGGGGGGGWRQRLSRLRRVGRGGAEDHLVDCILHDLWIHDLADRRIGELSGGQLQRTFIAKALAADPRILILDEPVTGVDAQSTELFYGILRGLNRSGMTILWSSHDMDAIGRLAGKLACLNRTLFFHGDPRKFFGDEALMRQYSEASMQEHMRAHETSCAHTDAGSRGSGIGGPSQRRGGAPPQSSRVAGALSGIGGPSQRRGGAHGS